MPIVGLGVLGGLLLPSFIYARFVCVRALESLWPYIVGVWGPLPLQVFPFDVVKGFGPDNFVTFDGGGPPSLASLYL